MSHFNVTCVRHVYDKLQEWVTAHKWMGRVVSHMWIRHVNMNKFQIQKWSLWISSEKIEFKAKTSRFHYKALQASFDSRNSSFQIFSPFFVSALHDLVHSINNVPSRGDPMDYSLQVTILVGSWPLSSQILSLFRHSPSQQNVAEKVLHGKPKKGICNQIESGAHLIEESRTGTGTVLKVNSCGQEQTCWVKDKRIICNPSDLLHYHHTLKQDALL